MASKKSAIRIVSDADAPPEPIAGVFTELARASVIPPKWIIKNLIPVGLSVIGAPPKALKSTFMMAVCMLIAGVKTKVLPDDMASVDLAGRIMGFSYEASAGELLHMCEEGLGVTVPDDGSIIIADSPWDFQLDDEHGLRDLLFWLDEFKPRLVFIDPLAEAHTLDEKDAREMIRILRPLHRWAKENDAAIVIVHHTRKRGVSEEVAGAHTAADLRGSSAIFGKMDGVLIFTPHTDTPGLITIDAKFTRGKSWIRNVQFAAYGESGHKAVVSEVLDDVARMTLKLLRAGVSSHDALASSCGIGKKRLNLALDVLVRLGKVARVGRKLKVCKQKSSRREKDT